ncbi:MAG: prepilin-type N-terminal cleavage/methylation domain-containing protein [Pseudoxanthomonas sp.]|nr:prepilin-type N-terminal cleavage/methylation domain-containing protein [Pseudoxanthomonas sp.]
MNRVLARRQRGFTLIEVIIAFALLALALTLLLGSLSGGSRQIRQANMNSHAALHAQSLLAQIGVGETLRPGRSAGTFAESGYAWTLEVVPYQDSLLPARPADPNAVRLMQLRLVVFWGEAPAERLQLDTLRLVPPVLDVARGPP